MRVLAVLQRSKERLVSHPLSFASVNGAGNSSFNGEERPYFLLSPGQGDMLPEGGVGILLPKGEVRPSFFLSVGGDVLFRILEGEPLPALKIERGGFIPVSARAELLRPLSVGVLTVSDKGSRGEREDLSGPVLARCVKPLGAIIEAAEIRPDDLDEIASILREWSDVQRLNLVLTTGGTGLSKRDVTPEALSLVADKHAPGIGEAMRVASMRITPKAMLSRLCAVTRGETLIVALPGSEKAVEECFSVIAPALRHGVEILCGWGGECGSSPDR